MDLDFAFFLPRPPLDFERFRLEKKPFFFPVSVSTSRKLQARHSHVNHKQNKKVSQRTLQKSHKKYKINRVKNLAGPRPTSLLRAYSARLKHAQDNLRNKLGVRAPRWRVITRVCLHFKIVTNSCHFSH